MISSKFLICVCRTVDFPGLVAVPCVVCELKVVFGVPTQRERGIVVVLDSDFCSMPTKVYKIDNFGVGNNQDTTLMRWQWIVLQVAL